MYNNIIYNIGDKIITIQRLYDITRNLYIEINTCGRIIGKVVDSPYVVYIRLDYHNVDERLLVNTSSIKLYTTYNTPIIKLRDPSDIIHLTNRLAFLEYLELTGHILVLDEIAERSAIINDINIIQNDISKQRKSNSVK